MNTINRLRAENSIMRLIMAGAPTTRRAAPCSAAHVRARGLIEFPLAVRRAEVVNAAPSRCWRRRRWGISMPHTGSFTCALLPWPRHVPGTALPAGIFIRLSESSRKLPETTMRSPASTPFDTTMLSPKFKPVSTSRGSNTLSPRSTYTVFLRPESITASTGTVTACGSRTGMCTSTNTSGRKT